MNEWFMAASEIHQFLGLLFLVEVILQPILGVWLVIIAMRIRCDQESTRAFLAVWGDRLLTTTVVPDTTQLEAIHSTLKDHDNWERTKDTQLTIARAEGKADGVEQERTRQEGQPIKDTP